MCCDRDKSCVGWSACGTITVIIIVLVASFIGTSVHKVQQDEFAVQENTYTMDLSGPYTQGTYLTQVGVDLITIKKSIATL